MREACIDLTSQLSIYILSMMLKEIVHLFQRVIVRLFLCLFDSFLIHSSSFNYLPYFFRHSSSI